MANYYDFTLINSCPPDEFEPLEGHQFKGWRSKGNDLYAIYEIVDTEYEFILQYYLLSNSIGKL